MFNAAKKSDLFNNQEIQLIPHPISSRIWRPINKNQAKKIQGLFGVSHWKMCWTMCGVSSKRGI